jgi:hypothetical protein
MNLFFAESSDGYVPISEEGEKEDFFQEYGNEI